MTQYEKPQRIKSKTVLKACLILLCLIGFIGVQIAADVLYRWNDDLTQLRQLRGFSFLFVLATVAAAHIRTRDSYVACYGLEPEAIHLELLDSIHRRFWWKILLLLGVLFFFFQSDYRFGGVPLIGWLFMFGGVVGLVNYLMDLLHAKKGAYRILEDKVTGKRKDTDSDGVHHFVVVYANEEHSWEKKVSGKEYLQVHLGDTYTAVYLKWRKKPALYFPVLAEETGE